MHPSLRRRSHRRHRQIDPLYANRTNVTGNCTHVPPRALLVGARSLRDPKHRSLGREAAEFERHHATDAAVRPLSPPQSVRFRRRIPPCIKSKTRPSFAGSSIHLHQTRAANWVSNLAALCMHTRPQRRSRGHDTRARAAAASAPLSAAFSHAQKGLRISTIVATAFILVAVAVERRNESDACGVLRETAKYIVHY